MTTMYDKLHFHENCTHIYTEKKTHSNYFFLINKYLPKRCNPLLLIKLQQNKCEL